MGGGGGGGGGGGVSGAVVIGIQVLIRSCPLAILHKCLTMTLLVMPF